MQTCCHLAFAVTIAVALTGGTRSYAAADGFVLICNARASTTALSKADVRSLYTGKAKTLGGNAVVVVIRSDDDVPFTQFADQIFGVATKTLLSKIKQEVFKGEMSKPVKAATDDDVVQNVSASPGTIGVVSTQRAGHLPKTVTVIAIGG
jgi:ABC-type phosphate transport system substrate-binding protein